MLLDYEHFSQGIFLREEPLLKTLIDFQSLFKIAIESNQTIYSNKDIHEAMLRVRLALHELTDTARVEVPHAY